MSTDFRPQNEGVSIYSPETGWEDRPFPPEGSEVSFLRVPKERSMHAVEPSIPMQEPILEPVQESASGHLREAELIAQPEASGLSLVGESLERLFLMLEQGNDSGLHQGWQEVVGLCKDIDAHTREKEEALMTLKALDSRISSAQSRLIGALDALAVRQRQEIEAAQIRAELSAAVSAAIQKKFKGE